MRRIITVAFLMMAMFIVADIAALCLHGRFSFGVDQFELIAITDSVDRIAISNSLSK